MTNCEDDLFCGVNRAETDKPEEMEALEKKHTPVIKAPEQVKSGKEFEVVVKLGEYKDHPNEHNHFIQWVELYSGDTFLGRQEFASARANPIANFRVELDHIRDLKAVAHCNLHGTWENERELESE